MSSQDGRDMDRPPPAGSVRRARERALAGLQREDVVLPRAIPVNMDEEPQIARPSMPRAMGQNTGPQRLQRPPPPPGLQTRDGQIGVAISRPTPVPQWPLAAPSNSNIDPYQPPPGRSQPPQRPPRPSRVPSILDSSKVQDMTPVFQYRPQSGRDSAGQELLAVPETPSNLSRASTLSSAGSIPDFPLPAQLPPGPPRRSVNLGPPPSARRGASSFYSNASYVSPIPEESPRSRSHASFASSAAMPESWGEQSPGPSPNYPDAYYDDIIAEESAYGDDDEEESRLVRSASVGKRAKPTLVSATVPGLPDSRPGPTPVQNEPFKDGTGYVENSSSASTLPTLPKAVAGGPSITPDAMLNAYSSASATDLSDSSARPTPSPQPPPGGRPYSRLSAIRRPPRLDIDAVKKAESRGSLTSLPDLIRRATRLAASLEKGRRPASRFDDFDEYDERALSYDGEKHQSGFSDMLAAFPPPAQAAAGTSRRSWRESIRQQVQSWPLPLGSSRSPNTSQEAIPGNSDSRPSPDGKRRRRCCGLPLWGFLVVMVVVILLIAAAVAIPIEFFVVRKQRVNGEAQAALEQCQSQITCANGGSNVVNQGFCSCICTNGFTGFDCTLADSSGCTTISLTGDMAINNVTIGDAIPRLIQQAQTNFSIPLSSSNIVAKLNSGNLSCSAMNALVTFDGSATRQAAVPQGVFGAAINGIVFTTITILAGQFTTVTLNAGSLLDSTAKAAPTGGVGSAGGDGETGFTTIITAPGSFTTSFGTTITLGRATPTPTSTSTVTMTMSSGQAVPTTLFAVTDEVLDFSRVAVLYILQQENLNDAKVAQSRLQRLFNAAGPTNSGVSVETARNVTLENGNSIDLVDFVVRARGIAQKVGKKPAIKLPDLQLNAWTNFSKQ
ncbi:hypothetical protein B0H67DRAFT_6761 [Lasiosphaeris hirsuta]|uniref:EGF-like domain-containing protein n=1 Tax=Lasiosphaeris hirsuta TaxID=260670 RepID=A0AA40B8V6_9PEZI|nr:hypothetical protein B0H67DRAFT_6761 [Lasiosphaeris hirsuta]